jgi:hypothetical protein
VTESVPNGRLDVEITAVVTPATLVVTVTGEPVIVIGVDGAAVVV